MTTPLRTPFDPPEIGDVTEVEEGVLWTRMPLPKPLSHVNCYLFEDDAGWTLIDTGVNSKKTRDLWTSLMEGALASKPIHTVIATHHHLDHIGLAGWFMETHGAELVTTRTAYLMARMLQLDVQELPTQTQIAFWKSCGMKEEVLAERIGSRPFNTADAVHPIPLGYRRIKDGDTLVFGNRSWAVRTGDGHAPEHATFWSDGGTLVVGGDQLLGAISPNLGVHATEPEADPVGDWLASCEGFVPHARDEQLVLTGHKLPYTGLPTRLTQLIENHERAIERLLKDLETPKTACECFKALFKREISGGEYGLAMVEAMAHCRYLEARGLASGHLREDGALEWTRAH